jgi:hypothetical protein
MGARRGAHRNWSSRRPRERGGRTVPAVNRGDASGELRTRGRCPGRSGSRIGDPHHAMMLPVAPAAGGQGRGAVGEQPKGHTIACQYCQQRDSNRPRHRAYSIVRPGDRRTSAGSAGRLRRRCWCGCIRTWSTSVLPPWCCSPAPKSHRGQRPAWASAYESGLTVAQPKSAPACRGIRGGD